MFFKIFSSNGYLFWLIIIVIFCIFVFFFEGGEIWFYINLMLRKM